MAMVHDNTCEKSRGSIKSQRLVNGSKLSQLEV